jgi:hypothetical protein
MFAAPMTRRLAGVPNRAIARSDLRPPSRPAAYPPQDEFTFDTQKLGDAPALFAALGLCEPLVDDRETLSSLPVTTEGVCNLGEK